ncbi:MAG: hypothetical protein EOO15_00510 [Chitinophagaceae bacterium]|nr:MAG: hypothetical protein EOO15_00510 [Chitinophagaceae bacterium]
MKRLMLLALPLVLAAALLFVCLQKPAIPGLPVAVYPVPSKGETGAAADTTCTSNPTPVENPGGVHPTASNLAAGMTRLLPELATLLDNYTEAELDPRYAGYVQSKQGTRLAFPPFAFELPDGTIPTGPVTVTVQEFYQPSDIALAGLFTMSGRQQLESGGMVYVDARYNGQRLQLRDGMMYGLDMPFSSKRPDMQLFEGRSMGDRVDWQPLVMGEGKERYYRMPFVRPGAFDTLQRLLAKGMQWPQDVEGTRTWWDATIHFNIDEAGKPSVLKVVNAMSPGFVSLLDSVLASRDSLPIGWADGRAAAVSFHQQLTFRWPERLNAREFEVERSDLFVDSVYRKEGAGYYTFRSPVMGWINCDRFYSDTREKEALYVKTTDPSVEIRLAFSSINSMVSGRSTDSGYVFDNLPKGEPVTVIGIRKEGTCYELALREIRVGDGDVRSLRFETLSMKQAHQRLQQLNKSKPAATVAANPRTPTTTQL